MANDEMQGAIGGAAQGASSGMAIAGPWGAAVGGILGGATGLMSGMGVSKARREYENQMKAYMEQLSMIDMPRYEDLKLALERFQKGEQLTPDQLSALQEVDSEVSKITENKVAKQSQLEALAGLRARARGGLTLQDKADLMSAQREIDKQTSGAQKAIIQNMQARGQTGSGQELAMRLAAQQQGAQQASQNALNVAAQSRNTALQALKDSAAMGRQIGQDDLELQNTKAKSIDELRRRNLERQQAAMQYNISNNNAAKQANWDRANKVSDANTNMGNEEQKYNKNLLVDDYHRQIERLNMLSGPKLGMAQDKVNQAKAGAAGMMGAIGSVGNLVGSMKGGNSPMSKVGQNPGLQASDEFEEIDLDKYK